MLYFAASDGHLLSISVFCVKLKICFAFPDSNEERDDGKVPTARDSYVSSVTAAKMVNSGTLTSACTRCIHFDYSNY